MNQGPYVCLDRSRVAKRHIGEHSGRERSLLSSGKQRYAYTACRGKNLESIVRGTMPALQVLLQNHMLDHLYVEEVSFADGNIDLALLMKQLAHRYPRMNIAGIGAGTGGTT